jgi:hypothetical protein
MLSSKDVEELTKIPEVAKVNTTGLNKKILFQHFKQGFKAP